MDSKIKTRTTTKKDELIAEIKAVIVKKNYAELAQKLTAHKDEIDSYVASSIVLESDFSASSTPFGERQESFLMMVIKIPLKKEAIESIIDSIDLKENHARNIIFYENKEKDNAIILVGTQLAKILSKSANIQNLIDALKYSINTPNKRNVSEDERRKNFNTIKRTAEYVEAKELFDLFLYAIKSLPEELREKNSKILNDTSIAVRKKIIETYYSETGEVNFVKSCHIADLATETIDSLRVESRRRQAQAGRRNDFGDFEDEGGPADVNDDQLGQQETDTNEDIGLQEDYDNFLVEQERHPSAASASYDYRAQGRIAKFNQLLKDDTVSAKLKEAEHQAQKSLAKLEDSLTPRDLRKTMPKTPSSSETKGAGTALGNFSFQSPEPTSPRTRSATAAAGPGAARASSSKGLFSSAASMGDTSQFFGKRGATGESSPPKLQTEPSASAGSPSGAQRAKSPQRNAESGTDSDDEVVYV